MKKQEKQEKQYTPRELFGNPAPGWLTAIVVAGLLAIVVATLVPLLNRGFDHPWFRYVYAAGAAAALLGRMFTPYTGIHPRMKRLHRLEAWSGIFFCAAAFFMFYDPRNNRDWLAFTLAGGAVQVIATFLSSRVAAKALKGEDKRK